MSDHEIVTSDQADLYKNAFGGMDFARENAADKFHRISTEGSLFRLMAGKQELRVIEERAIRVIIVNSSKRLQRTLFDGTYVKGQEANMVCWSDDGVVPRADVPKPQCHECKSCPKNQPGSGANGARACQFSRRLAVVMADDPEGPVYSLKLSAKGMFGDKAINSGHIPFHAYEDACRSVGAYMQAQITEIKFSPAESVPVLTFKAVGQIPPTMVQTIVAQCQSEAAKKAVVLAAIKRKDDMDESKPAQAAPPAPPSAATAGKPSTGKASTGKTSNSPPDKSAALSDWPAEE